MFNSLASFILGNGNNRNATDIEDQSQRGATDEAIDNFKFVSTNCKENDDDDDSEWLLVEKRGKKRKTITITIAIAIM